MATKDETKRATDAVNSIQDCLNDFNPEAEVTIKMQESLDIIKPILGMEVVTPTTDEEADQDG